MKTTYYWVSGEGTFVADKLFFETPEKFLNYLQMNDPIECGAEELTQEEALKIFWPERACSKG